MTDEEFTQAVGYKMDEIQEQLNAFAKRPNIEAVKKMNDIINKLKSITGQHESNMVRRGY